MLARIVAEETGPGDLVVCLGAGTITNWANALPDELARIVEPKAAGASL